MEVGETKPSSGYAKPPWLFKGSALYQLHLVKAETARAFIPKEFRLVEAFGYTLGGFFLAHYDDSPAGIFDEYIGLPSQFAGFSKRTTAISERSRNKDDSFLNKIGFGTAFCNLKDRIDVQVAEIKDSSTTDFCCISLPTAGSRSDSIWMGPIIKMSLPSFSGRTQYNPHLLKYSCQINCRVRAVAPAKVSGPITPLDKHGEGLPAPQSFNSVDSEIGGLTENGSRNQSISVLLSKPVLALEFNFLKMQVEPPIVVGHCSKNMVEGS